MRSRPVRVLLLALGVAAPVAASAQTAAAPPRTVTAPPPAAVAPAAASREAAEGAEAVHRGGFVVFSDLAFGAREAAHVVTAPTRWTERQWARLPAAVVAVAALASTDGAVESFEDVRQTRVADHFFGLVEPFGQGRSFLVIGGLYAGGLVLDRPKLRRTAVEALAASVVAGGLVTPALKLAVGRARPRQKEGPFDFDPFSGDVSFPSGHTTQAFAVASVIAAESEAAWVDALAYGLAGSVAAARIYHDAHFLSDVVTGAAIGTVVGRSIVHNVTGPTADAESRPVIHPLVGSPDGEHLMLGLAVRF